LQKFQQKALKQTKQKKSKSAEFLMVKEERAAEGIENPAFNSSHTDLSSYQALEDKVIRYDRQDSTLAAHQQNIELEAHSKLRGNEYSRNYFDPSMDEEINPRQYGMEVSIEDELELSMITEDAVDLGGPDSLGGFGGTVGLRREVEKELIPPYVEQFEQHSHDDMIVLGSLSLEQVRVKN
ncbi:orofacial cleft 1 candidate gene 1 protein homolog, partial [Latimeria chalumnae]|uniref:orofacial cleft 1 candidate gene 1 protein homolog n=1 Tax=Latimeria chalumnae TaxID=7897 RepID=UPI00313B715B